MVVLYAEKLRIVLFSSQICLSLCWFHSNALMFSLWISFLDCQAVKVTILFILILTSSPILCGSSPVVRVREHSAHLSVLFFSFQISLDCLVYQKWYCITKIQGLLLTFGKPCGNYKVLKHFLQAPTIHRQMVRLKEHIVQLNRFWDAC